MKFLLMFLMMISVVACSGSKSTNEASTEEAGIELADTEEFIEEDGESLVDEVLTENTEVAPEAMMGSSNVEYGANQSEWVVTENETLMIIAFKLYGDYEKWKDLAAWNSDKLGSGNQISKGMMLKYMAPVEPFVWNPEGNPYLIQKGDSLGKISNTTYGTRQYWKNIWDNNRPLIKDPNKIFAGFTLYTPNIDGRGVANNN